MISNHGLSDDNITVNTVSVREHPMSNTVNVSTLTPAFDVPASAPTVLMETVRHLKKLKIF
jgi:hypothetical protein